MRKLNATLEPTDTEGQWEVTVTDIETGEDVIVTVKAASEREAAFKAMEEAYGNE